MKYESNTSMHSKRYRPETIFRTEIKGHNSDNNLWILPLIELGLYFMILMNPMLRIYRPETIFRTDKGDAICPTPPTHPFKMAGAR